MAAITMKCPSPDDLMMAALGRTEAQSISDHIAGCASCSDRVNAIRESIGSLHAGSRDPGTDHVSDDAIALLADGDTARLGDEDLAHVADCASCRARLVMLSQALDDDIVQAELRSLEPRLALNRSSRIPLRYVSGLAAAAAAAIVLLGPVRERTTQPTHREAAITTTAAPRIMSPTELSSPADSLRWTTLAQADLYRVRVWDSEGTLVWTADTRDTTIAIPADIRPGVQYLWELKARTGWDRWVASDLSALTLRSR